MKTTNVSTAYRVIIIHGMAVVHTVAKMRKLKHVKILDSFPDIICHIAATYNEVRLVFDMYIFIQTSFKDQMREKRTKGTSTFMLSFI